MVLMYRNLPSMFLQCKEFSANSKGILADDVTFLCGLRACANTNAFYDGLAIHAQIVEEGFDGHTPVCDTLVDMYARCGYVAMAENIFHRVSDPDTYTWNALITGYAHHGLGKEALKCFKEMQDARISPDVMSYVFILKACAITGSSDKGEHIHVEVDRLGLLREDIVLGNAIIDMYIKCGMLAKAKEVLYKLPMRDPVSWTALIAGYAQHGESTEARKCFYAMEKNGLKPDVTTFTVILAACCHAGQVDEGYWYFNSMKEKYGVSPTVEHFNCLIDLLGRSGRLCEASQLLKTMPELPDIMGWMSLLTACRKYGDKDLGPKCFKEILSIDPENRAAFTLMSNIYRDAQMWDEVGKVEKLRACANAWKKHATALIQVDGVMHEFVVGDTDCPQHVVVNSRLKALKYHMEELGYVPRLDIASDMANRKESHECTH